MLKQNNLPFLLLILSIGKTLVQPASIFDAVAIVAISVLFGFKLYLDHIKKPDFSQEVSDKFVKLQEEMVSKIEALDKLQVARMVDFETKVSTLNLAMTNKKTGSGDEFKWGR
jgi:hypothetical protein